MFTVVIITVLFFDSKRNYKNLSQDIDQNCPRFLGVTVMSVMLTGKAIVLSPSEANLKLTR